MTTNLNGLSKAQITERIRQGKVNKTSKKSQKTLGKIILKNTLTIFNLVNLILAIMIISVGAYKNLLFILIAIANTLISIINEIRAKKTVDKMRLISEQKPTVIRDGKTLQINQDELVEGDLMILSLGDQIIVDAKIEQGNIEVNESFVTGEQDNISKKTGDALISGGFIVSGTCKATATNVGDDSFIAKLEKNAHTIKTADSKLFTIMNNIVKYISFALIPIGILLLWARFRVPDTTPEVAVTSAVAALINMIPEGLILLTSSVLALATIRLSKKQVLVQDLYSIETLARVDTIALDKTGTLTTGKMTVHDFILPNGITLKAPSKTPTEAEKSFITALTSILSHQTSENATITALSQKLAKAPKNQEIDGVTEVIDFSSERKHSGFKTKDATYLLGAVEFITNDKDIINQVKSASDGYRTLAVVRSDKQSEETISQHLRDSDSQNYNVSRHPDQSFEESVGGYDRDRRSASPVTTGASDSVSEKLRSDVVSTLSVELLGIIRLEDELRSDAKDIIGYFYNNNIDVRIISGDDLTTVQDIANRVGVKNLTGIDLSSKKTHDYDKLVKDYTIFTRVTPSQKKSLILALKKQDKTVAMTGDGVNDILAMKEADCSIAIGEGSDAARRSAKLVLMNSNFSAVPKIIDEGRQSINNLERSTTLFLSKTIYAGILAVLFTILPIEYPYAPIEMSLLNFACIGLPGLILALEHNTSRIKDQFVKNIKRYSVPTGIIVSISMVILSVVANLNHLARPELITLSAIITFAIDFILIYRISKPLNLFRSILMGVILAIFLSTLFIPFLRNFFDFTLLF